MPKAILFDIDGVLLDTHAANTAFYQKLMEATGYPSPTAEDTRKHFHLSLHDSIRQYSGETDEKKVTEILAIAKTLWYPLELMKVPKDAQRVVRALAKTSTLGLVTSRIRRGIDAFYEVFGHEELFSVAVAAEDCQNLKPHPEPILRALKALDVSPKDAVYVGDMPSDIEAAKAAKVRVILMSGQKHPGADAYVQAFSELLAEVSRKR